MGAPTAYPMKRTFLLLSVVAALLLCGGCGHVDLTPEGDPNRVITGSVNVRMNLLPPPDSQIVVRLVAPPDVTAEPAVAAGDMVLGERGSRERPEQVVAEQIIKAPSSMPVPFRIEFSADDARLRRGLNVEARISWGGQVRFRNTEAIAVTLSTVNSPITIWVEPLR